MRGGWNEYWVSSVNASLVRELDKPGYVIRWVDGGNMDFTLITKMTVIEISCRALTRA